MHNFKGGMLYMFERMMLFDEIVQYHMDNNEHDLVIKACKKYSYWNLCPMHCAIESESLLLRNNDWNLWLKALSFFANKDSASNYKAEIVEVQCPSMFLL